MGALGEAAFAQLADELGGSELQSILLEVLRRRAAARTPHDVLAQYRRDPFVRPAASDQRTIVELDGHLLAAATGFEAIELSPLAPLGTCSTMAPTDQHRIVSALRGTEVTSDTTNVLAMECADRLRAAPDAPVHFVTSHRVVRAQPAPNLPGAAQHFRLFALASAGRERADHAFTAQTVVLHVRTLLAAFDRLEQHGYRFGARRIEILARSDRAALADRIATELEAARGELDHPYYDGGLRYRLWVTGSDGVAYPIGDGGTFGWVARLTASQRNVFVASGVGAQLIAQPMFRAGNAAETSGVGSSGMPRASQPVIHVHHRGDRGVDGILRLIELAGHDGALELMLSAMCDELAAIADVDIASIYVREEDMLVMRGNHGFPRESIGTTRLAVGEGITGLVAECMRPVSAAHAAAEAAYKHVPGLGEEKYPVFVGVPLIGSGSAIGVLVLQRRKKPFATDEVTLATALGAPVTLAIERRRLTAVRSARLTGIAHVGGAVLGRAAVVPTVTAFDQALGNDTLSIERAFARLRDDLGRAMKRLAEKPDPATGGALDRFALALCDARLRERLEAVAGQPSALRAVAKEYARAPYRLGTANDYVAEIEELCALLGDSRGLKPGSIWIADRINAVIAIVAVARGASAIVACDVVSPDAIAIARAARLPCISDVGGLFSWARPNDLLAVDGDAGAVLVHPAQVDIEKLRRAKV